MTTWVTPSSRMVAKSFCRVGASGVVSFVSTTRPLMRVPVVPMMPVRSPACISPVSRR